MRKTVILHLLTGLAYDLEKMLRHGKVSDMYTLVDSL